MTKKRVWQQSNQRCAFCTEAQVETLHIHHIKAREDGGDNNVENLLLVCATCHEKITHGVISEADVITKKRELNYSSQSASGTSATKRKVTNNMVNFSGENSGIVANSVTFKAGSKAKVNPPQGTVGADPIRKNYMAYLLDTYHDCRMADKSFGCFTPYNPGEIRKNIIRQFARAGLYHVPLHRFEEVCEYITGRIDRTILAKTRHARGQRMYCSFSEFQTEH